MSIWGEPEDFDNEPVRLTERMLSQPPPYTRGLIVNRPARSMTFHGRLFQARMWREYAMTWHGKRTRTGIDRAWCEQIGRWTYAELKRRARVNLYLAKRLRRPQSGARCCPSCKAMDAFGASQESGAACLADIIKCPTD